MTDSTSSIVRRDISIDALRGIAVILMVAGHVIGMDGSTGMRVSDDSPWRYSYLLLEDLRMPLFTALSGYVYSMRRISRVSSLRAFFVSKVRRLLVPLVSVGTVFMVMQAALPGTNADTGFGDIWRLYVYGAGHFWFLYAVFLLFTLITVLDRFDLLRTPARAAIAIGLGAAISAFIRVPAEWSFFALNRAFFLLPFFLLGYAVRRYWDRANRALVPMLGVALALFATRAVEIFDGFEIARPASAALGVLLGVAGIASLLFWRQRVAWPPLASLGRFSFAIYLLHVFATAPARMVLGGLGLDAEWLVFAISMLAGLAIPVLFEMTLGRVAWISWTFLGQKPYRPRARTKSIAGS